MKAFIKILGMVLGLKRSAHRVFRRGLLCRILKGIEFKKISEILLNTQFIKIKKQGAYEELELTTFPLSDLEREFIKEVFILVLPSQTQIKNQYEKDVDLTHQLTYCFIKP
jgi:hypothetical protein